MTTPHPSAPAPTLGLDAEALGRRAVNLIRVAMGIGGVAAVVLGVLVLVWPGRTLVVGAYLFGIYFLVSGIIRAGTGVFATGVGGGMRVLHILFGILLVVGGVIVLKDVGVATVVLLIMLAAIIGIGWIIEGVVALAEAGGAKNKGVAIALGVLSILAGVVVLLLPGTSIPLLLVFGAVALIVLGVTQLVRAFTFGRSGAPRSANG